MRSFPAVIEKCADTGLCVGHVPGFQSAHSPGESVEVLHGNLSAERRESKFMPVTPYGAVSNAATCLQMYQSAKAKLCFYRAPRKQTPTSSVRAAFTLVELLVVIAVIGILASLGIASLSRARTKARITECSSNFRQLGIACSIYAGEDSRSRLPAFALPLDTSSLSNIDTIRPFYVNYPLLEALEQRQVPLRFWFCAANASWSLQVQNYRNAQFPGSLKTIKDFRRIDFGKGYAVVGVSWWVQQPLGATGGSFPDAKFSNSRQAIPFLTTTTDVNGNLRPIASDTLYTYGCQDDGKYEGSAGAHGPKEPLNSLWLDGHVASRAVGQSNWEWRWNQAFDVYKDHAFGY